MSLLVQDIVHNFPDLILSTQGDLKTPIVSLCSSEFPKKSHMVFVKDEKELKRASEAKVSCIVSNKEVASKYKANTTLITTHDTRLLFAKVTERFFPQNKTPSSGSIHSSVTRGTNTQVDPSATLCAGVVLGENIFIGKGAYIGPHCIIEENSHIGEGSRLDGHIYIGPRTQIGKFVYIQPQTTIGSPGYGFAKEKDKYVPISQNGKVVIEDHVTIGANCTIDRATLDETRIGEGTKFDNLIHIAHNCKIGKHSLITSGFGVAGNTKIGDYFVCGGKTTVTDHVEITDHVQLAGLSVVSKNIKTPGRYGGYPLTPLTDSLKWRALLPKVPQFMKRISQLEKVLNKILKEKN